MGREGSIESQQKTDLFWFDIMPNISSRPHRFRRTCRVNCVSSGIIEWRTLKIFVACTENPFLIKFWIWTKKDCFSVVLSSLDYNKHRNIGCVKLSWATGCSYPTSFRWSHRITVLGPFILNCSHSHPFYKKAFKCKCTLIW